MKITFTGTIELLEKFDDRGSVDIWLLNTIEDAIKQGPELDDIYEKLGLIWWVVDES